MKWILGSSLLLLAGCTDPFAPKIHCAPEVRTAIMQVSNGTRYEYMRDTIQVCYATR